MAELKYHPRRDECVSEKYRGIRWGEWFKRESGLEKPKVLDVGAGKGYFLQGLLEAGCEAYAVDLREEVFEGDKSRFFRANARSLPFGSESFDLVTDIWFTADLVDLQFTSYDTFEKIVNEVTRVLKVGGYYMGICSEVPCEMLEGRFVVHPQLKFIYIKNNNNLVSESARAKSRSVYRQRLRELMGCQRWREDAERRAS